MVTDRVRIDSLAAGQDHLAQRSEGGGSVIVVAVGRAVPPWLGELVRQARDVSVTVAVEAVAPAGLDDESRAGWEIGIATAALAVGAEVTGLHPQRVARVREVTRSLDAARPASAPEPAP